MLQLPNILTLARIAMVPLIILCYYAPEPLVVAARWAALILFVAGAATDYLDGWAARKYNMFSNLGRFLDPIADKLTVTVVLIMLIMVQRISGIHVIAAFLIIAREILISGLREFLGEMKGQIVVPVSRLAKHKTGWQMGAMIALLVIDAMPDFFSENFAFIEDLAAAALWFAAILSVITGWSYFKAFAAALTKEQS